MVAFDEPLPYIGATPFQLVSALIILIVGYIVAKILISIFKKSMRKTKLPLWSLSSWGGFWRYCSTLSS